VVGFLGWVALSRTLQPGTHVIGLTANGTITGDVDNVAAIIVKRS